MAKEEIDFSGEWLLFIDLNNKDLQLIEMLNSKRHTAIRFQARVLNSPQGDFAHNGK